MTTASVLHKIAREAALNLPRGAYVRAVQRFARETPVLAVLPDDAAVQRLAQGLDFFGTHDYVLLPAWDCLPFDRVSPHPTISAERLAALARLKFDSARIILTTVNALLQKTVPPASIAQMILKTGGEYPRTALESDLHDLGYGRAVTVHEMHEYAIRGDIVDIFPAGAEQPLRLGFFGDTLETIRSFDAVTQISHSADDAAAVTQAVLMSASEAPTGRAEIFRKNHRRLFGRIADDPILESVLAGRHEPGVEHHLPLFFDEPLPSLLGWLPSETVLLIDDGFAEQCGLRLEMIADHYQARLEAMPEDAAAQRKAARQGPVYWPVPSERLYLDETHLHETMTAHRIISLTQHAEPLAHQTAVHDFHARAGQNYQEASAQNRLFELLKIRLDEAAVRKQQVIFACVSEGSRTRLGQLFAEHDLPTLTPLDRFDDDVAIGAAVWDCDSFQDDALIVINEENLFGAKMRRRQYRRKKSVDMLSELNSLQIGDYVIHAEHGIGRYQGLQSVTVDNMPYECLHLAYADKAALYLPVENIDLLSLYARSEQSDVKLDALGSAHWQQRKARMKKHLLEIAQQLADTAAKRQLQKTDAVAKPEIWESFCARFPFAETDDQLQAIDDVVRDLQKSVPMDRLLCGDAGFGKTEIALRAALMVACHHQQVILMAPTTLLVRQHYQLFTARFQGFGIRIAQLSRLVSAKDAAKIRKQIAAGEIDIIIGTHSLLSKAVTFKNPGLLIIDEEQHFGVKQKEQLKQWPGLHILTMTATPIPRSLNFALAGLRDLSLMATPPVDRLAVRTFVTIYDSLIVQEAIRRERLRGGQIFCVVPRIGDLPRTEHRIRELAPEALKMQIAHGQMPPAALEQAMTDFVDGDAEMLLSTNIIESGLDIPRANTILIFHPDKFGLAQLYQLRGRVGRGKLRGYCYLILPGHGGTIQTRKRLEVMQSLDSTGAGFQIASHDMDLRGSGNLLGEAQSGRIAEVGVELYHKMLRQAVTHAKGTTDEFAEDYSPQVKLNLSAMLPESYINDAALRMGLYQRLAGFEQPEALEEFAIELSDRFGALPQPVQNLLKVMSLRLQCRRLNVETIATGSKGLQIVFRDNRFAAPEALLEWVWQNQGRVAVTPKQHLTIEQSMPTPAERLKRAEQLLTRLQQMLPERNQ